MRRIVMMMFIVGLLATGCGAQSTAVPPTIAPNTGTAVPGHAAELKDYIASDPSLVRTTGRPQVVEFFAFWCVVCQSMRPLMHQMEDKYGNLVDFIYLDIDADNTKQLRTDLTFTGLRPTIIFLSADGVEHGRLFGAHTEPEITALIDPLLSAG